MECYADIIEFMNLFGYLEEQKIYAICMFCYKKI